MDAVSLEAEGWHIIEVGGFSGLVGPYWWRGAGSAAVVGFLAEERHANHIGTVHGGMLMTFADIALGYGVVQALKAPRCATAQLALQFVATAKFGEFITCQPEVVRRTEQLIFVRGLLCVDDKVVASADGIWKVLRSATG